MRFVLAALVLFVSSAAHADCMTFKPFARFGCEQVCVGDQWQEVCEAGQPSNVQWGNDQAHCGFKPFVKLGCEAICMNGSWQEICR